MAFNQINQKNVKLQMKQPFVGVLQNSDRKKILKKKKKKKKKAKFTGKQLCWSLFLRKLQTFSLRLY